MDRRTVTVIYKKPVSQGPKDDIRVLKLSNADGEDHIIRLLSHGYFSEIIIMHNKEVRGPRKYFLPPICYPKEEGDDDDFEKELLVLTLEENGEASVKPYWSSSSTSNAVYLSSTTTMERFVISPNARLKRKFKSWMRGEMLGAGSFGTVYKGFTNDGFFLAVKEVSLSGQGSNAKQSIAQLEQSIVASISLKGEDDNVHDNKEIALLSQLEHENIVQYYGTEKNEGKLYIFMELVTQGSLASLYQKNHLLDLEVAAHTRQILKGLNYLHEQNVIHRDIKCANILVDGGGSVKLADFGLAKEVRKIDRPKYYKRSVYWMAPEVVDPKQTYGCAADIWRLGCTVLEMLTRQNPYPNLKLMGALFKILQGDPPPIPNSLSEYARDFITRCVKVNPEDRPSASQLLEHPFVTRLQSNSVKIQESRQQPVIYTYHRRQARAQETQENVLAGQQQH